MPHFQWKLSYEDSRKYCTPEIHQIQNSNVSTQIQIRPKSQSEFVPRDTEESEFLDTVRFGGVEFSVETVIAANSGIYYKSRLPILVWGGYDE